MENKRYLFRGFHPDKYGTTKILIDGVIWNGDWFYWNWCGVIQAPEKYAPKPQERNKRYFIEGFELLPETIGQWVTTDKNGKDLFVGDNANMHYFYEDFDRTTLGAFENENTVAVTLTMREFGFGFEALDGSMCGYLSELVQEPQEELELISNKWECAE